MKITVTLSGDFSDELDDGDLQAFREDLEDECRYYGGKGVVVEVQRG